MQGLKDEVHTTVKAFWFNTCTPDAGFGSFSSDRHAPPTLSACPLRSDRVRNSAPQRIDVMCHDVWPGRAVQDGLPRSTNVRAASMYQASEVEQFAPGHHGYPRASEAD